VDPNGYVEDIDASVRKEEVAQLLQPCNDDFSGDEVSVGSKGRGLVTIVCVQDSEDVATGTVVDGEQSSINSVSVYET
jgi:hypothetical protein